MNTLQANIYIFNPTCEYSIANGNENWVPNRILRKMEADLSLLPTYFTTKNDFVLVNQMPTSAYLDELQQLFPNVPNFVLKNKAVQNQQLFFTPIDSLRPWGWSPTIHKFLSPFKLLCSDDFKNSPVYHWTENHKIISSRKFSAQILEKLLAEKCDFFLPLDFLPKTCTTQPDFKKAFQHWGKTMIKAPWSSSGRGLQKITKQPIHPKVWEKLLGIVNEQGYAMAEPYLNKVLDFAQQFEVYGGKAKFLGTTYFSTDQKGQYMGNYLNGLPENTDDLLLNFACMATNKIVDPLKRAIEESDIAKHYEGPLGVDMLIYKDDNNVIKINPCLEINVRNTMGLLALHLEKLIAPNQKGMFHIFFQPGKTFFDFAVEMTKKHPTTIQSNKIEKGFFPITEPGKNSLFGAYILV